MIPKVGDTLYLQIDADTEKDALYKARVVDIDSRYMATEIPIDTETGKMKAMFTGDLLAAYFMTEGGIKNYFNAKVLGIRDDTIKQMVISKPAAEDVSKVQRRTYLRVPAELEFALQVSRGEPLLTYTNDISGGGLSFTYPSKRGLENGEVLQGWLLLHGKQEQIDHIQVKGQIVRTVAIEGSDSRAMVSFTEISKGDRQKVIRYCFERQFELRK